MEKADGQVRDRDLVPYLMGRAARSIDRQWLVHLRGNGVTIAQWQVLAILGEYDGARLGQLARMSGADQPVTTRVVDQMERDGLVRREPAPDDRRAVEVHLEDAGRELFTAMLPAAGQLVERATAGLDDAAISGLVASLSTLVANLDGPAAELARSPRATDRSG